MTAPAGAEYLADCHVHVFDPVRFPYNPDCETHPSVHETATLEQLIEVFDAHGVTHGLVVTPTTGYGIRNEVTADALKRGPGVLKGVAVVPPDIGHQALSRMRDAGFVGVRVDVSGGGGAGLSANDGALPRMLADLSMVLQVQVVGPQIFDAAEIFRQHPGPVVLDHIGQPDPRAGIDQPGFQRLLSLADNPYVHVKLSGAFRFSRAGPPYRDCDAFMTRIVSAFGASRCVWGSDWPYVRMGHRVDFGPCQKALERWVPDAHARRTIMWHTPKSLFGFKERT